MRFLTQHLLAVPNGTYLILEATASSTRGFNHASTLLG